jgi:acetyl esterase/lipase
MASVLFAAGPPSRLDASRLEAAHAQRIEWMKKRAGAPQLGVYEDFRAVFASPKALRPGLLKAANDANAQVVFSEAESGQAGGVLFLPPPQSPTVAIYRRPESNAADRSRLKRRLKDYPDEAFGAADDVSAETLAHWDQETETAPVTAIAANDPAGDPVPETVLFRNASTHILARELTGAAIETSLAQGHAYVAHDWLCDPTGFTFVADNFLGVFDMGDTVGSGLLAGEIHLDAYVPVAAHLKLIRNGLVVADVLDSKLTYTAKEQGVYRLEAWLTLGGEERPWIFSNPIYVRGDAAVAIPQAQPDPLVELTSDITYTSGDPADEAKHKLDLYLPKGRKNFPVLLFVHGGSWRTGDRSLYRALGVHLAHQGIGVAIPSYRLMPRNPHPAQIEDVAAAFAWVYRNAASYGGDLKHLYISGHSAGGHLVALLALNPAYLSKFSIPISAIHGVIAMSGVYDVRNMPEFAFDGDKTLASPIAYATSAGVPPFLITYCQWDYLALPKQARDFAAALRKAFADAQLLYIPSQTHVGEIISAVQDDSPLAQALASFIK